MGTFTILMTLIGGAVFAALVITASRAFEEDRLVQVLKGVIGAGAFIATGLLAPTAPAVIGLLTIVLPLSVFAYLFYWWAENGSTLKELGIFILMGVLLYFQAMAAAVRAVDFKIWFLGGLIMSVPRIVLIMFVAFIVSNMIKFRMELKVIEEGGEDDDEE